MIYKLYNINFISDINWPDKRGVRQPNWHPQFSLRKVPMDFIE